MNSVAIKEIADNMQNTKDRIKDIFDNIDELMMNVNDNDNWKGNTNEAFINRYKELKEYFPKIIEGINTYGIFLDNVSTNYEYKENDIKNNIENNDINLDVN